MEKKSSENDQLTGHFQSFFIYFFRPPDTKSEKKSRKSTNKKNLALIDLLLCALEAFIETFTVSTLSTITVL